MDVTVNSVTAITRTGLNAGASAMLVPADWIKHILGAATWAQLLLSSGVGMLQIMRHSQRTGVRVGAARESCIVGQGARHDVLQSAGV